MSTYAVFGMTKHRAVEMARRTLEPWHKEEKRQMTPAEFEASVQEYATNVMAGTKTLQLSEKFDAPQFAREFLKLAEKSEHRSLHIKSYAKTGETHPKTHKPIMAWNEVS